MTGDILQIKNVTKQYSGVKAVDGVSLSVPSGTIYGLLGPNGAGKTSLIRMITTITLPDEGVIQFKGQELKEFHSDIMGYMPEERGMYRKMKVREQLEYFLRLKGKSASEAREATRKWLQKLDILSWSDKKTGDLSKGMQQKIQFIGTVAHEPELIILDEPFSGLDPINSQMIEAVIRELKKNGKTIIFSTHRMEQVEEFCDRIALINRGKLVLEGDVNEVRKKFQEEKYLVCFEGDPDEFNKLDQISFTLQKDGLVEIVPGPEMKSSELLKMLSNLSVTITKFEHPLPRLNEIFIRAVKESESGVKVA